MAHIERRDKYQKSNGKAHCHHPELTGTIGRFLSRPLGQDYNADRAEDAGCYEQYKREGQKFSSHNKECVQNLSPFYLYAPKGQAESLPVVWLEVGTIFCISMIS